MIDALLGQSFARHALARLLTKPPPAALLLLGPAGTGKQAAARAYCRAALCVGDRSATCPCRACRRVATHNHPALRGVYEENLTVDLIREVVASSLTLRGDGRQYVLLPRLDRAAPASLHALLKVLEEPTARTTWVLTSRTDLIPTILSRCWTIRFGCLGEDALAALLPTCSPEARTLLAGQYRPDPAERFQYLHALLAGQDEHLPDKIEAPALAADLRLAAACVWQARRTGADRFGPLVWPRLDAERADRLVEIFDQALVLLDSVRPWLCLEWVRNRVQELAT